MAETAFPEIYAYTFLPKSSGHTEPLEVNEATGALVIPEGIKPTGFFLQVEIPGHGLDVTVARKDVGTNGGGYHMQQIHEGTRNTWRTTSPIEIFKDSGSGERYTRWHHNFSNRLDIFVVQKGGEIHLLQAGVVIRGSRDMETYHLLCERLWHGQVVRNQRSGLYVGVPYDPAWGSFVSRNGIFNFEPFRRALGRVAITPRVVSADELEPWLGTPAEGCYRMDWFLPFGGRRGQGIARTADGTAVWVVGNEVLNQHDLDDLAAKKVPIQNFRIVQPEADGIVRLRRGMDIRSLGIRSGFSKKDGPKYLQGIYLA